VLHTWGQTLQFHPHVHCVVPGGGLSPDGTDWIGSRPNFFLPVVVLSRVFRGKFLARLRAAFAAGRLHVATDHPDGASAEFERLVSLAVHSDWVVYAKPPFGGPEAVLKYLARYTHRAAISNSRLLDFEDGIVRFRYKDYAHGNQRRVMKLSAHEFVRRFLLHLLPTGFVRIRHYGILSTRQKHEHLALCRKLLSGGTTAQTDPEPAESLKAAEGPESITPTRVCPRCGAGRMIGSLQFLPLAPGEEIGMINEQCMVLDSS
jgi:hypothetical protein